MESPEGQVHQAKASRSGYQGLWRYIYKTHGFYQLTTYSTFKERLYGRNTDNWHISLGADTQIPTTVSMMHNGDPNCDFRRRFMFITFLDKNAVFSIK